MYCDYDALSDYASNISQKFNDMMSLMDSVDIAFKNIESIGNWDSPTRDYFYNQYASFQENYQTLINKYNNIKQYLETVAENYRRIDS